LDALSFLSSFFLFALSSSGFFNTQEYQKVHTSINSNEEIAKPSNKKLNWC
jgi:thiol:disulfide interchange protein